MGYKEGIKFRCEGDCLRPVDVSVVVVCSECMYYNVVYLCVMRVYVLYCSVLLCYI